MALCSVLDEVHDITATVGSAEVSDIVEEAQVGRFDIILWDQANRDSGPKDLAQLLGGDPSVPLVVMGLEKDPRAICEWLRAGVHGYVLGDSGRPEFLASLRQASQGEIVLPARLAVAVLRQLAAPELDNVQYSLESLSVREKDVLERLCHGATNKMIAQTLFISVRTVEGHLANIYAKLGVNSRTEAALIALRHGWS
jgi:DNA-binding NarL/FixJ family response regulator